MFARQVEPKEREFLVEGVDNDETEQGLEIAPSQKVLERLGEMQESSKLKYQCPYILNLRKLGVSEKKFKSEKDSEGHIEDGAEMKGSGEGAQQLETQRDAWKVVSLKLWKAHTLYENDTERFLEDMG